MLDSALQGLSADLDRLAGYLDSVLFRDVWRAVACAITMALYNDVATEARFSQQVLPHLPCRLAECHACQVTVKRGRFMLLPALLVAKGGVASV